MASLEWVGIRRDQKWLVLKAWDGKFSAFFRKKFGNQKMRLEMQTSIWKCNHIGMSLKVFLGGLGGMI